MEEIMKKLLLSLVFLSFAAPAYAFRAGSFSLSPTFSYTNSNVDLDNTLFSGGDSDSTSTSYDIKLGWTTGAGLYLGGLLSVTTSDSSAASYSPQVTSYGLSVGYVASNGFYFLGHYFLSSVYDSPVSSTSSFENGSGFQFDLGFLYYFNSSFALGPQITYRNLSWKKYKSSSTATAVDSSNSVSNIAPQIALAFTF
ncbi:MAG: hypothetical protein D6797_03250 [Bdellovibrio sp.]|nr:MAG: hypothetical protein D6797_03250 [Bdellovibrio sp.]